MRKVEDVRRLLNAGADKVSINTAAVQNPALVREASRHRRLPVHRGGDRREEARSRRRRWEVFTHGGRKATGLDAVEWARRMEEAGAGEILLTSMDRDGTRDGFDLGLTRRIADAVGVPVIASGGVGTKEHFAEGVTSEARRCGARRQRVPLRRATVKQVKEHMKSRGIEVRL